MVIDRDSFSVGNKAMAQVLMLYYRLLEEGGITHEQTVYLDPVDFCGFTYLDVQVEQTAFEIDESLLREGATICLLCDLDDAICDYSEDYLSHDYVKRIIAMYDQGKMTAIPEVAEIFSIIRKSERQLDYEHYNHCLIGIYEKYVVGRFERMLKSGEPLM